MKERPIIFSTDMVKAILEGRKTQTRRMNGLQAINLNLNDVHFQQVVNYQNNAIAQFQIISIHSPLDIKCPYGQVGNRLWVRETFHATDRGHTVHYKADGGKSSWIKWQSSIHMPCWASRITLEITKIRVERLQEITEEDIKAEGFDGDYTKIGYYYVFGQYWNKLNEKRGYLWESNPFVWVIDFRRV